MFVVFGETAVATEPGEGALDHPTLWQHVEALGGGVLGNGDEKAIAERLAGGFDHRAGIAAVGVEDGQAGDDTLEPGQQRHGAGPVLNIGRVGQNGEQESERIDHDVALAASHLLAGIPAARPPLSVVLTLWLSMIAADGLASRPSASRAAMRRTCSISSHTPAAIKARQYPYTVGHGGYPAGRWRHWQPVRNTWNSPSSTSRNFGGARPSSRLGRRQHRRQEREFGIAQPAAAPDIPDPMSRLWCPHHHIPPTC